MIDEQPYILVSYQAKIILPMCEYLPTPVPAFSPHAGTFLLVSRSLMTSWFK